MADPPSDHGAVSGASHARSESRATTAALGRRVLLALVAPGNIERTNGILQSVSLPKGFPFNHHRHNRSRWHRKADPLRRRHMEVARSARTNGPGGGSSSHGDSDVAYRVEAHPNQVDQWILGSRNLRRLWLVQLVSRVRTDSESTLQRNMGSVPCNAAASRGQVPWARDV